MQQHLPLAVCAEGCETAEEQSDDEVRTSQVPERSEGKTKVIRQQYLPFTVLKRLSLKGDGDDFAVATTLTACGIETEQHRTYLRTVSHQLQQHLPLAVCAAECEAAEVQSDDEVHTLLT